MSWRDYIDLGFPPVFNPKVTPNPVDAERLEKKLQQANRKIKPLYSAQAVSPSPTTESITKHFGCEFFD